MSEWQKAVMLTERQQGYPWLKSGKEAHQETTIVWQAWWLYVEELPKVSSEVKR